MYDGRQLSQRIGVWHDLYRFVYRNLRKQGLSHFDAEDLAQDILETAYVHLDNVEPGRQHAWLLKVMRNKLVDRARTPELSYSVPDLPEGNDPALGPDEMAVRSADRGMLREAIGRLSERDRRLIEVRYLHERSIAETADVLGISPGAAKVALHRARERLRVLLQAAGMTGGEAMAGIAERAVRELSPYVGPTLADTFVRGTAISIGKTFDTLTIEDAGALEDRARRTLQSLLPPDAIERVIADIRGGS
jgi:RNA polymerase sigma-70 factor (ECF subfamily)